MKNKRLRQKKLERNKKRRKQILKRKETVQERIMRVRSNMIAGSRHAARKLRKKWRNDLEKMKKAVEKKKFKKATGMELPI